MRYRPIIDKVNYLLGHAALICRGFSDYFKIVGVCKKLDIIIAHELSDALQKSVNVYTE